MVQTTTLGYPRIGRNRELKRASEAYWAGTVTEESLYATGAALRRAHWEEQCDAGIDLIPSNDFSFYDHVLDAIALVGAVPSRFRWEGATVDIDTYFAMARGIQRTDRDAMAMEMTKWFDTNYHYIVPEWHAGQRFHLASSKPFDEFGEAQALGISTKPVLLGPLSLVLLGKAQDDGVDLLGETLTGVVAVYGEVIARLAAAGAQWIQLDEPCLAQDRTPQELAALHDAYAQLAAHKGAARLIVTTYFGHAGESYETLATLPVEGIGLDVLHEPVNRDLLHRYGLPADKTLVAGIVDGRNVWRTNLDAALDILDDVTTVVPPERLVLAPTCSLLHVPYDVTREEGIDPEIRSWLAFAEQKLDEVVTLSHAMNEGRASPEAGWRGRANRSGASGAEPNNSVPVAASLQANREVIASRASSQRVHSDAVQRRLAQESIPQRLPFAERRPLQAELLKLPLLPTTTIGSFPQTGEVRHMRSQFESGRIGEQEYDEFIAATIADTIARQESLGFDVLVHGECERNDMVQYFGERLSGFVCTRYGWVQSYGSRYVRPPIIYGDVARPGPITVRWSAYAQSQTTKPVKGMLTGPVTILNWSFVRDDQPRDETCRQIALALKDEVADLERAGLRIIQIDEPALREGLPLRRDKWQGYLTWAVNCFRLASSGAAPATQIHSHMCYSSFEDILDAVSALDADVVSIENARDGGQLLNTFRQAGYDKQIGPGIYDVHSPRVPDTDEIEATLQAILDVLPQQDVWVNPDCGLKTRGWEELTPSLEHLIAAAHHLRARMPQASR